MDALAPTRPAAGELECPGADHAPPRGGLHQSETPRRAYSPGRCAAFDAGLDGRLLEDATLDRVPRRAPRPGPGTQERRDGGAAACFQAASSASPRVLSVKSVVPLVPPAGIVTAKSETDP